MMNLEMAEFSMKKELYRSVSSEIVQSVCRSYHPKIKCMKHGREITYTNVVIVNMYVQHKVQ